MSLVRIAFAIIVGVLVCALLEWLATSVPHGIDVLIGVVAAFVVYFGWNGNVRV